LQSINLKVISDDHVNKALALEAMTAKLLNLGLIWSLHALGTHDDSTLITSLFRFPNLKGILDQ